MPISLNTAEELKQAFESEVQDLARKKDELSNTSLKRLLRTTFEDKYEPTIVFKDYATKLNNLINKESVGMYKAERLAEEAKQAQAPAQEQIQEAVAPVVDEAKQEQEVPGAEEAEQIQAAAPVADEVKQEPEAAEEADEKVDLVAEQNAEAEAVAEPKREEVVIEDADEDAEQEEARKRDEQAAQQKADEEAQRQQEAEEAKRKQEEVAIPVVAEAKQEEVTAVAKAKQEDVVVIEDAAEEENNQVPVQAIASVIEEVKQEQAEREAAQRLAEAKRQQNEQARQQEQALLREAAMNAAIHDLQHVLNVKVVETPTDRGIIYEAAIDGNYYTLTEHRNNLGYALLCWSNKSLTKHYRVINNSLITCDGDINGTWVAASEISVSPEVGFAEVPSTGDELSNSSTVTSSRNVSPVPDQATVEQQTTAVKINDTKPDTASSDQDVSDKKRSKAVIISAIVLAVVFGLSGAAILIFTHGVAAPLLYALGALIVNNIGFALPLTIASLAIAGLALSALAAETRAPESVKEYFIDVFTFENGRRKAEDWGKDLKAWQKPFAYTAGFIYGTLARLATPVTSFLRISWEDSEEAVKGLNKYRDKLYFEQKTDKELNVFQKAWNHFNKGLFKAISYLIIIPATFVLFPVITLYKGIDALVNGKHEDVKNNNGNLIKEDNEVKEVNEAAIEKVPENSSAFSKMIGMLGGKKVATEASDSLVMDDAKPTKGIWYRIKKRAKKTGEAIITPCRKRTTYERI